MPPKTSSHSFLHAYCLNPDVKFESQQDHEEVILVLRAHPVTQIHWIFNSVVLLFILIILNTVVPLFFNVGEIIFTNLFGIFIIISYAFYNFLHWFFNVGIISNERIIDIDFENLLYKEVTEALLARVEDTTSKSGGFFESFFNYGDLFIQTAGTAINIEFLNIPNPGDAIRIIQDLMVKP